VGVDDRDGRVHRSHVVAGYPSSRRAPGRTSRQANG
jgi:hypothetical protein